MQNLWEIPHIPFPDEQTFPKVQNVWEFAMISPQAEELQDLLSMPDHLRKTLLALNKVGVAAAEDVAAFTGNCRAYESANLNDLARMGRIFKSKHKGQIPYKVYYSIHEIGNSIQELSQDLQSMLMEDLVCAMRNRLAVLLRSVKDGRSI